MEKFVDVILPLPLHACFTYSLPEDMAGSVQIGCRVADYYLCTRGDVYKAALPSGLKLESETIVEYNPDFESDVQLPEKEQKILDLLAAEPEQCITKLEKESGIRNILSVIKSLLDKEAVFVKAQDRDPRAPDGSGRQRTPSALLF